MQKKKSPFLMQRNWRGSTTSSSEKRGRDYSAPRNNRSRSYSSRSASSGYSCGSSSKRSSQPEGRDPSSIRPDEVICHGMQVTNVDNYIANLFR